MLAKTELEDSTDQKVVCAECGLVRMCVPMGFNAADITHFGAIMKRPRTLRRGDQLFGSGNPFNSIFVLRSGAVKCYVPCEDGNEQVIGFYLQGDLVGLDSVGSNKHICSAEALETSSVCELPYEELFTLSEEIPSLRRHLLELMGRKLAHNEYMLLLLGKATAEERLATFIVNLSLRFKAMGFSENEFNLRMSRHDIGNYLGLAVETVSRMFSRLHDEGILTVHRKNICIHDLDRLRSMINLTCSEMTPAPRLSGQA